MGIPRVLAADGRTHEQMTEMTTDILIVGGGTGGVAAALAAADHGARVVMTEPTDWIGGQLTAQAVPPDENRWIESVGGTRRYQAFRERVRGWYRSNRRLTARYREAPHLNPGNGWVSRLCFEPRIGHAVLLEMLGAHIASGRVTILTECAPEAVATAGDRIGPVSLRRADGALLTVAAKLYLDATELGDVYPLAGIEHEIGAEGRPRYGEFHAPPTDDPMDQQAFSWCFAMEHRPGESHVIEAPASYSFWRDYMPRMEPAWTGRLFSWTVPSHNDAGRREFRLIPWPDEPQGGQWELWRYRRITDRSIYAAGDASDGGHEQVPPDVCLVNWVQMDYWLKPLLGVSPEVQVQALRESRELSLSLLYWMQTEAPRHDGSGGGYPGLRLRGDELGTTDGFAKAPYIREPRRLRARTMVHEGHIGIDQRTEMGIKPSAGPDGQVAIGAEPFADSVGIGHYTLDLHPSTAGRNSVYVPAAPFRIPLSALIPVRARNLIAAGKGIGVSHIANACYRMHHTEWNIGESAGAFAAFCLAHGCEPHAVCDDPARLMDFQAALAMDGVRLAWPWE